MRCSLPPELLDHIVDHLHDDPTALKACSVVARSWVPRARSYLFARVEFDTSKHSIEQWMKTFPDPSNSPAHHTRNLIVCGLPVVTSPSVDISGWIWSFHNLVHLHLKKFIWEDHEAPLLPFHGLSPTVRSLHLASTSFEVFDLICSFPLLEDLTFISTRSESIDATSGRNVRRVSSPKLTGSLLLSLLSGMRPLVRRLLDLPNGLHFAKITLLCRKKEDGSSAADLLSRCSGTLESLTIHHLRIAGVPFIDLSEATKLRDLTFRCARSRGIKSLTMALQTAGSENLRRITIHPYIITSDDLIEEATLRDWWDLDLLLVQLWASRSVRTQFMYGPDREGKEARDYAPSLLPELTGRGVIDLLKPVPP